MPNIEDALKDIHYWHNEMLHHNCNNYCSSTGTILTNLVEATARGLLLLLERQEASSEGREST